MIAVLAILAALSPLAYGLYRFAAAIRAYRLRQVDKHYRAASLVLTEHRKLRVHQARLAAARGRAA